MLALETGQGRRRRTEHFVAAARRAIDPETLLPPDESDHGLDNIAEVLSMSPTLLQRYLVAARKISRLAVGDPAIGPGIETFDLSRGLRQDERA